MKQPRKILFVLIFILSLIIFGCSTNSSDDSVSAGEEASVSSDVFQAGAAIKTLAPSDNPEWYKEVCLGGFGIMTIRNFAELLSARATGVHDKPYARVHGDYTWNQNHCIPGHGCGHAGQQCDQ